MAPEIKIDNTPKENSNNGGTSAPVAPKVNNEDLVTEKKQVKL